MRTIRRRLLKWSRITVLARRRSLLGARSTASCRLSMFGLLSRSNDIGKKGDALAGTDVTFI